MRMRRILAKVASEMNAEFGASSMDFEMTSYGHKPLYLIHARRIGIYVTWTEHIEVSILYPVFPCISTLAGLLMETMVRYTLRQQRQQ